MDDEQPDSLEGWVPVRDDLFAEPERRQLRFLVAWNDAEAKFAVTCHDRTAQRRRREGSRPEPEPEPGPAASPPSWAGLLSAAGLRGAHRQLAALWPPLERCFPPLPPELDAPAGGAWGLGLGLWALVWPARAGPGDAALQELCGRLERYLGEAASGCGGAAVRDALFPADGGAPDCESLRDFRGQGPARAVDGGGRAPAPGTPGPSRRLGGAAGLRALWVGVGGRAWADVGGSCSREPGGRPAGQVTVGGDGAGARSGAQVPDTCWRGGGRRAPEGPRASGGAGRAHRICQRIAETEPETAVARVGKYNTH